MKEHQTTIKSPVSISGVGLHTGQNVNLTFIPAPPNHGYKFKRIDLEYQPIVEADVDYVFDTSRGTSLKKGDVIIRTAEHALASLYGMGIDNVLIEMDNSEPPIMDGSSKCFTEALNKSGIEIQKEPKRYFEIADNLIYRDENKKVEIIAVPDDKFKLSVMIDYDNKVLGAQHASLQEIKGFDKEIAPSRTFVFLKELEYLLQNNLIKGGDLNNAIVFVDSEISQKELDRLAKVFNKPSVAVLNEGILNNLKLNFPNEPARHKLLDVVGDLALVGMPIKGHIIAERPGHHSNVQFAKMIKEAIKKSKIRNQKPEYDIFAKPVYDINDIKRMLPHRPPFLLIDKILEISDQHVVGLKNVTINESFFTGHFPEEPVMPGVLLIEAMAQTGGILVLSTVPDPNNYSTYFLKIENVKFRNKVIPGDTIIFTLKLVSPIRRGICHMEGVAYVGDKIVMEAVLMAQISKK